MGKGNLAKAMVIGLEKRAAHAQVIKRKRILKRFLKTDQGKQFAQQIEAGEIPVDSIAVDSKGIEVKATVNTDAENSEDSSPEDSENESKGTEEDEGDGTDD